MEKVTIHNNMLENYLVSNSIWKERMKFGTPYGDTPNAVKLFKEAKYHFYFDKNISEVWDLPVKLMKDFNHLPELEYTDYFHTYQPTIKGGSDNFIFPHYKIREYMIWFEEYSSSPVPKSLFIKGEEMERIYFKIKSVEDNFKKWLEYLQEANDTEFVKQNVEYRIGQNLDDKNLWKLYIQYLCENDTQEMLHVYSKYCRYFLDDFEMKNEYKTAVEKYGPVYVPWKNLFEFENSSRPNFFKALPGEGENPYSWESPKIKNEVKKCSCPKFMNFSEKHILNQPWRIPTPLIRYFVDHARPLIYSKLQQTCKYFYYKKPNNLFCYRFYYNFGATMGQENVSQQSNFKESSFLIWQDPDQLKKFNNKKLSLTTSLHFSHTENWEYDLNKSLSNIIKNYIFECKVKYIEISNQHLNEMELKFLVGHGNVESFKIRYTYLEANGDFIILENLLKMLPNIRMLDLSTDGEHFLTTSNELSNLKFNNKILFIHLDQVKTEIHEKDLCSFIMKNLAPYSTFHLQFNDNNISDEFVDQLKIVVDEKVNIWQPLDEKPYINIGSGGIL